jgi:hypothetical protein
MMRLLLNLVNRILLRFLSVGRTPFTWLLLKTDETVEVGYWAIRGLGAPLRVSRATPLPTAPPTGRLVGAGLHCGDLASLHSSAHCSSAQCPHFLSPLAVLDDVRVRGRGVRVGVLRGDGEARRQVSH